MTDPTTETRCKPWCDADFITDGHVCASWLVSIEGYNLAVVDNPGGQPTLILHGTAITGEVRIPAGEAKHTVALLAAIGNDDLADLFREGLRQVLGEVRCSYCERDVPDLRHPAGHDLGCPGPVPVRTCGHAVQPCECSEGGDE